MSIFKKIKSAWIKHKYDVAREMIWERNHLYGKEPKFGKIEDIMPDEKIKEYMSLDAVNPNSKLFKELKSIQRESK